MGKTYSEDLRLKALAALDGGMKKMAVHRTLGISRSTLDDWLLLRSGQDHVAPLPRQQRAGQGFFEAFVFEAFAVRHQGATLKGMQEAWESERGQRLSEKTFSNWLLKLGWTRKKRALSTPSDTKTNGAFLEELEGVPVEARVYVDEARVDDTLSYAYGWSRKGTRCLGERLGHQTQRVSMAAAWC